LTLNTPFRQVDPNGEGAIDFNTFCRVMQMPLKAPDAEPEILQVRLVPMLPAPGFGV
jgi:hypothetical protein